MKYQKFFGLFLIQVIFLFTSAFSCHFSISGRGVDGSGDIISITKDYTDFHSVRASHSFNVSIKYSNDYSVRLEIDKNIEKYLIAEVEDGVLMLGLESGHSYGDITLEAEITMPDIKSLGLSGASRCRITDFNFDHKFRGRLSGSSRISAEMNTGDLDLSLSGSSKVVFTGNAKDLKLGGSGSSRFDLKDTEAVSADISLSGASKADVFLDGELNASLSGASKVNVYGDAVLGRIRTSGSSEVEKR